MTHATARPRLSSRPTGDTAVSRPVDAVGDDELLKTWQLFRRAMGAVDGRLAVSLAGPDTHNGLTCEALARLAATPNRKLPMTELAATLGMSSGGLTKFVDRLVQAGFVYREHSSIDRRVVYAVLTDAGAEQEQRSTPTYLATLRSEMGELGPQKLRALRKICHDLQRESAERPTVPASGTAAPSGAVVRSLRG